MKSKKRIIVQFENTIEASKFYLNGLLFCLGREDLIIDIDSKEIRKKILKELKDEASI